MFKALLLATVAGAGAANIPAPNVLERSSNPPSYLCSSVNKKCSQQKQQSSLVAYCSPYLKVPNTVTKTITKCSTTTKTTTQFTATVTEPATVVTSTIKGCVRPSRAPIPEQPTDDGGDASAPAPEGKRDAAPESPKGYTQPKPACLSAYKKPNEITTACGCVSPKPKTTTTTTVTTTKTVSRTIKTASTVKGDPTTKTIYEQGPLQTFAIARDFESSYLIQPAGQQKRAESGGFAELAFNSNENINRAILFQLNNPDQLTGKLLVVNDRNGETANGKQLGIPGQEDSMDEGNFRVHYDSPVSPSLKPLTCSISFDPLDGTCPLDCQAIGPDDVSQLFGTSNRWNIGPAGVVSEDTYKTFAVTREDVAAIEPDEGTTFPQPGPDVQRG